MPPDTIIAQTANQRKGFSLKKLSKSKKELDNFLNCNAWNKPKPGLIISFDDGVRTNFEYARPILEKYNFTGWFFVPTGFIECSVNDQHQYAIDNRILIEHQFNKFERLAMSWDEVKELSENEHVIGSHTSSHCRMFNEIDRVKLAYEIVNSKKVLEERLCKVITSFCWVGGEEYTYTSGAAEEIKRANYKFSFMTNSNIILAKNSALHLDRTNIESSWSKEIIYFQLSGFMDLFYYRKRKRIHKLTGNL